MYLYLFLLLYIAEVVKVMTLYDQGIKIFASIVQKSPGLLYLTLR